MEQTINSRLKEVRKFLDFTQKEMAEMLGVQQSYYSDVENGKRVVGGKIIESLYLLKSISSDWMFSGKGEMLSTKSDNVSTYPDSPISNRLLFEHYQNALKGKQLVSQGGKGGSTLREKLNNQEYNNRAKSLEKELSKSNRKAINEIKKDNNLAFETLTNLISLSEQIDILSDVSLNYFEILKTNVPMDTILGFTPLPNFEDIKKYLLDEITPAMSFNSDFIELSIAIKKFLVKIKALDKLNIIP